jgi:hypothetical protein
MLAFTYEYRWKTTRKLAQMTDGRSYLTCVVPFIQIALAILYSCWFASKLFTRAAFAVIFQLHVPFCEPHTCGMLD